jgi:stage III sporulation protein SpoIIIAA
VDDKYALASRELIETFEPTSIAPSTPLVVSHELDPLIQLLPADIAASLSGHELELSDIQLDKGRRPQAWCAGKRVFLGAHDRLVGIEEIDDIVAHLGGFGSDNRAGLEAQLHRISAIRNRAGDIIGLTMRVGRHVCGNAEMIRDVLFRDDASVLFLGEPGSGKTTIVREASRLLAEVRASCKSPFARKRTKILDVYVYIAQNDRSRCLANLRSIERSIVTANLV